MRKPTVFLLSVLAILGCDSRATEPIHPDSFLRAQVAPSSHPVEEHVGNAELSGGTMSPTRWASYISSWDEEGRGILHLQRLGASWREGPGVHELEPLLFYPGPDSLGNTALLLRSSDLYVAESGTVTVTSASHERVDGHFDIVVVYWCTPVVNREPCLSVPDDFPTDAPRIRLVGEFSATLPGPVPVLPGGGG